MILDLEERALEADLEADLCVIGSGPAGLSVATQFLGSPTRVVVLEGGGWTWSPASQGLYRGTTTGQSVSPLDSMRLRFFGGTSYHWGGLCRPLDASDFTAREWVENSGWPISRADLEPYLARTHEILDLGSINYALDKLALPDSRYIALDPMLFRHDAWRLSPPTRFGQKYKDVLLGAKNVEVLLNASVVEIVFAAGSDRVDHVLFKDPRRAPRMLRAKAFVLATGGIENARLLLASRSTLPTGIGNQNDLVGRYFHEHPHVPSGTLHLFDKSAAAAFAAGYGDFQTAQNKVLPAIVLSWAEQQRQRTLSNAFSLLLDANLDASEGYLALRRLLGAGNGSEDFWRDLSLVVGDLDGAFDGLRSRLQRVSRPVAKFQIFTRTEQAPHRDSRVFLNDERDDNGMPRVTLDWRLLAIDKHTLRTANTLFAREIGRLGLGRVQVPEWLAADNAEIGQPFHAAGHHMGTTRMAATSERGVVDRNCRVFGTQNLYVAGSSLFPTGGYANPTFTIVQLALRLADHLKTAIRKV